MAGICKQRTSSGKCRAWFTNWKGKQEFFTGTTNPKETEHMADGFEDRHRRIRVGDLPPPKASDTPRGFDEASAEYLAWGNAQGGRRGHPWGKKHAQKRAYYLDYWKKQLGLSLLSDLPGSLPRVEKTLRTLQDNGKAGKTLNNYSEGLAAFCDWCVNRGYLEQDPIAGLVPFEATPKTTRRNLTAEQARALLTGIDEHGTIHAHRRHMGYALALCTGLRKGELQALQVKNLDTERGGLRLEAAWTKNRYAGWQPLPGVLVQTLKTTMAGKSADTPLAFVSRESSEALQADLERAGMKRWGPGGKVDFHALRHTFITLLHTAGASFEEVRLLARHAARGLTDGTYLHVSNDRLKALVEAVALMVLPEVAAEDQSIKTGTDDARIMPETDQNYEHSMHKPRQRSGSAFVTVCANKDLGQHKESALRGFKSLPAHHNKTSECSKLSANNQQTSYDNNGGTSGSAVVQSNGSGQRWRATRCCEAVASA